MVQKQNIENIQKTIQGKARSEDDSLNLSDCPTSIKIYKFDLNCTYFCTELCCSGVPANMGLLLQVCPVILRLTHTDSMDDYRTEAVAVSTLVN